MTATEHREPGGRTWLGRIAGVRLVVAAAAIVLAALVLIGLLPLAAAVIGFLIIAGSAVLGTSVRRAGERMTRSGSRRSLLR